MAVTVYMGPCQTIPIHGPLDVLSVAFSLALGVRDTASFQTVKPVNLAFCLSYVLAFA